MRIYLTSVFVDDQAKALEALALRVQQLEDFVAAANAVNVLKNNLPPPRR